MKKVMGLLLSIFLVFTLTACDSIKVKIENGDSRKKEQVEDKDNVEKENEDEDDSNEDVNAITDDVEVNKIATISCPEGWKKIDIAGVDVAYVEPSNLANINLVNESAPGYSLDRYYKASKNTLENILKVEILKEEEGRIGKYDTKSIEYNYDTADSSARIRQVILLKDDIAYIITLTSTEDQIENFIDILEDTVATLQY